MFTAKVQVTLKLCFCTCSSLLMFMAKTYIEVSQALFLYMFFAVDVHGQDAWVSVALFLYVFFAVDVCV